MSLTLAEAPSHLATLAAQLAGLDVSELLAGPVASTFAASVEENFLLAASAAGLPWPLRKRFYPWPMLIKSGRMRQAALGRGDGAVREVAPRELTLAIELSAVPYARAQHFGYPPRNLPSRPYFGMSREHATRVGRILADGVAAKLWPTG